MDKNASNINTKREALLKLIAAGGDCSKLDRDFCDNCPLDSWRLREDGSYSSCVGAVEARYGKDVVDVDFARLALEILGQLEVENMLRGPDGEKT